MFDSPENSNSGKWKSPSAKDTKRPVTPLETDHTKRNQVMKRSLFKSTLLVKMGLYFNLICFW
jgi:hypothetical protein